MPRQSAKKKNQADKYVEDSESRRRGLLTLARWRIDPVAFVVEELKVTPYLWQAEVLRAFPVNKRLALQACKGPGKSACLSWLILNFLATRSYPKIVCTSVTGENLKDGLWAELGKWIRNSPFLKANFEYTKERISVKTQDDKDNWFVSARRWRRDSDAEQQEQTLAGLHADFILAVIDEAGGVPDAVVATADAVLTAVNEDGSVRDEHGSVIKEAHVVIAGNPTHTEGPLYRAATEERDQWKLFQVTGDPDDPNRAPQVSVAWAREQIRKYGLTSPWVEVNVFGKFPRMATEGLCSMQDVLDATGRNKDRYGNLLSFSGPKILGVDVSRRGTNQTVLIYRQGDKIMGCKVWHGMDTVYTAGIVRQELKAWGAEAVYVDDTGIGGGVTDILLAENEPCIPVTVGETAPDDEHHMNLRSQLAAALQERFREGTISIAPDVEEFRMKVGPEPEVMKLRDTPFVTEATTMRFKFDGRSRRQLEDKDIYKKRTSRSPDHWDALALTEAHWVLGAGGFGEPGEEQEVQRGRVIDGSSLRLTERPVVHDEEGHDDGELRVRRRELRIGGRLRM